MTPLDGWENFYLIVGPSAGALIGLQFVVTTLIGDMPVTGAESEASDAFATPSVVHFGVVLFLSAIVSAPWDSIVTAAVLWCLMGVGGLVYTIIVIRRMRAQTSYKPVFEDWLFHAVLTFSAYAMLAVSVYWVLSDSRLALYLVAASTLLLLFIGIHNSWDNIRFIVFYKKRESNGSGRGPDKRH